jgi:UDP-N-acetylglucosamine 4,6-dehydratase/UDP-glucose 4-epimerase
VFDKKKILITGGTGSLGKYLTKKLLKENVDTIRIYSRDEWKQIQMENEIDDKRLRFLIGDVRDKDRLARAVEGIDIVIHAAALKHVPIAEYNPFEAIKTNVFGSQNLIECCLDADVEKVLAVGTDKAVSPLNTYGASKMLMERLFISANNYKGEHNTKFLCVRYGNVLGSRGSLLPLVFSKIQNGEDIPVTDPNMTRFNITMNDAVQLIFRALNNGHGGEIFIPNLKAYKVKDMISALLTFKNANNKEKKIPVRQGEKFHEVLINHEELRNTYQTKNDFIIIENLTPLHKNDKNLSKNTSMTSDYGSNTVPLLTPDEIISIVKTDDLITNY